MEQFVKHYVKVEKYKDLEKQLEKMEKKMVCLIDECNF